MRLVAALFIFPLLAIQAVDDPLALNDPLKQLLVDTATKGDGDFLSRAAPTVSPLPENNTADEGARPIDPLASVGAHDSLDRYLRTTDTNAIPQLEAYLRQHPGRARGWQLLGEMHFRRRAFPEAEGAFRKAHELVPYDGKALNDYAASLIMQSKLKEASALLESELARRPANHAARFNLACVAVRAGRLAEAMEQLKRLEKERWQELALHIADSDLDPLRRLPEFVALQNRITATPSRLDRTQGI